MLSGKALFALGALVIAGTFVALMLTSRGPVEPARRRGDQLEQYAEQEARSATDDACADAVAHAVTAAADYLTSRYGEGAPDGIRALATHRCEMDDWSAEVVRCLGRVTSENELQRCIGQLPEYQRRAVEAEMKAFALRPPPVTLDAGVDAEEDTDVDIEPADSTGSSSWPPSCAEYEQVMERLASCDKLPQASRDALRQGFDSMKSAWGNLAAMSQSARDTMASGCQQAVDALRQAGASICGW